MYKMRAVFGKYFKTSLSLLVLCIAVGFLAVAGIYFVYGGSSGCGGSHVYSQMLSHNGDKTLAASKEQSVCPVMEMTIDKNVFTEYKGKKVYFCCPACIGKFLAETEKYVEKLPQFEKDRKSII